MTCQFVYAVPDKSFDPLIRSYTSMVDEEYVAEGEGRRLQAKRILEKIHRYKKGGRMLDIGCGPAFFLDEAKKKGWDVQGADLSEWAVRYADEHFKIPVFRGALVEANFPDRSFDVVVMNDVIEHLERPQETLREIRRILN
jgi:2-polyprenyl-3-methyl-5-hydroxy-6-metoxy-1,4-benzoquinol methylase